MSRYIIIRGPAGIGESTISRLLARRIDATVINFDKIMKGLGFDYIPREKWIPLHKFLKADRLMVPKFKKELESGKNIVFDGNFYHKEQSKT